MRSGPPTTPRRGPTRGPAAAAPATARSYASVDLSSATKLWITDGRSQGWSPRTVESRQQMMARFIWWLEHQEKLPTNLSSLNPITVRGFLNYLWEPCPGGRWGNGHHATEREPRPSTVNTYYRAIRAFCGFLFAEGLVREWPLGNVKPPEVPDDQVEPFSQEQVQSLMDAARRGCDPERDVAIILVLVDTGLRAAELCGVTVGDVDRGSGELMVTGKGNKRRKVYMGAAARRALWRYLETGRREAQPDEALFVGVGGHTAGAAITPNGLCQIIARCGKAAKVQGVRCSPHTLRHTFAVNFLRGGGNVFELQQLMGHEDLTMSRRYVELAERDLEKAHRKASPGDRMKLR